VGERLSYAGAYPVIDEVYGDEVYGGVEADKESDLSYDQHRRNAVKSRRHELKKRLIEPYEQQAGSFGQ
jgi:hypothetical protein